MDGEIPADHDLAPQPVTGFGETPAFSSLARPLERTRPWVRFLSILGFVFAFFAVTGGLLGGAGMALDRNPVGVFIFVVYPLIGALYVLGAVLLTRFANNIGQFLNSRHENDLAGVLDAQRAFWTFAGIMGIVAIVMMVVVVPLAILLGLAAAVAGTR